MSSRTTAGRNPGDPQVVLTPVPSSPTITSAAGATFGPGLADSFTVTTTGFPTPSVQETGPLPFGVSFVDNGDGTATLSGAPAQFVGGIFPLMLPVGTIGSATRVPTPRSMT